LTGIRLTHIYLPVILITFQTCSRNSSHTPDLSREPFSKSRLLPGILLTIQVSSENPDFFRESFSHTRYLPGPYITQYTFLGLLLIYQSSHSSEIIQYPFSHRSHKPDIILSTSFQARHIQSSQLRNETSSRNPFQTSLPRILSHTRNLPGLHLTYLKSSHFHNAHYMYNFHDPYHTPVFSQASICQVPSHTLCRHFPGSLLTPYQKSSKPLFTHQTFSSIRSTNLFCGNLGYC
jgi:hypothetical protein